MGPLLSTSGGGQGSQWPAREPPAAAAPPPPVSDGGRSQRRGGMLYATAAGQPTARLPQGDPPMRNVLRLVLCSAALLALPLAACGTSEEADLDALPIADEIADEKADGAVSYLWARPNPGVI